MQQTNQQIYIDLLRQEVVPALGCTEPTAVSLAVARAREALNSPVKLVFVGVSANIYKNGMGVGIPGTGGRIGLPLAAALGAVAGDSADSLELLKNVDESAVKKASSLIEAGNVAVGVTPDVDKLFVEAEVSSEAGDHATCIISGTHSHIVKVTRNDEVVYSGTTQSTSRIPTDAKGVPPMDVRNITVKSIYEFIKNVDVEDIEFILESERLNRRISEEGLGGEFGLQVGRRMWLRMQSGKLGDDLLTRAMAFTAAASDARMAGSTSPVMSNSGSGNQGLTATIPVVTTADLIGADREQRIRALALSHLVAIHIKGYLGRLSALCGCVVASTGAGCAIAYLLGGGIEVIESTVQNMMGNLTGMVCDGAKGGCALKVSAGVSCAVTSALLAIDGICISANDGIIDRDVEQTIRNLGRIGNEAMTETDDMVLNIMTSKGRNCD